MLGCQQKGTQLPLLLLTCRAGSKSLETFEVQAEQLYAPVSVSRVALLHQGANQTQLNQFLKEEWTKTKANYCEELINTQDV